MNHRGIFWGVFLVMLGTVFLLRQFGVIFFHLSWLFSWRLWPVAIIIAGLRLLLPQSSNLAGTLMTLLLISLFVYVIYEGYQLKRKGFDERQLWFGPGMMPNRDYHHQDVPDRSNDADSSDEDPRIRIN